MRAGGAFSVDADVTMDMEPLDFDKLLEELTQVVSCRRTKVLEVKRLVRDNCYETPGKLRVALARLLHDVDL